MTVADQIVVNLVIVTASILAFTTLLTWLDQPAFPAERTDLPPAEGVDFPPSGGSGAMLPERMSPERTPDRDLRLECLRLACRDRTGGASAVAHARLYLDFLLSDRPHIGGDTQ